MPSIREIDPALLRTRYRLSSQQINSIFGEACIPEDKDEKIAQLGILKEFLHITGLFREAGINYIPLKGPLLSYRLYGDATFRHYRDLDIMVDDSSVGNILDILTGAGYQASRRQWPEEISKQRRLLKYSNQILYLHPSKRIIFEIHWELMAPRYLNFRKTGRLIKDNLSEIDFAGRSFTLLNNELELLYLVIHGGVHNWFRLKWLADVNQFLRSQEIVWEKFNELSGSLNAGRLVALCNALLSEYFPGGPLIPCESKAPPYLVRFSKMRIEGAAYTTPFTFNTMFQHLRFSLLSYPGTIYKIRVIANITGKSMHFGKLRRVFGNRRNPIREL